MALQSGERQVASELDGIRRDHVARYEWAAAQLKHMGCKRVLDVGCGVGYGTDILAGAGVEAVGIDRDAETVAYAKQQWAKRGAKFHKLDTLDVKTLGRFGAAVAFEIIEHLEDPGTTLRRLRDVSPVLLASVPNEEVFPYRNYAFHFRHYTRLELVTLLNDNGWHVTEILGQEGSESDVEPDINGRTAIAVARRMENWVPNEISQSAKSLEFKPGAIPLPEPPKHVTILGLGPSLNQYVNVIKRLGGRKRFSDQVWAINALGGMFDCDLIFHMDDIRIQQIRAEANPESNIAVMLDWLKTSRVPVMTSIPHPDYQATHAFPLQKIVNELKYPYFNNTAAYAMAYAIYLGAKKISLFGCDYTYPNSHHAEKGRACLEFWCGVAAASGIDLAMPTKTSLMDALHSQAERLYGYDLVDVEMNLTGEGVRVALTPHDHFPTADEVEARYDHSAHPNALVSEGVEE